LCSSDGFLFSFEVIGLFYLFASSLLEWVGEFVEKKKAPIFFFAASMYRFAEEDASL